MIKYREGRKVKLKMIEIENPYRYRAYKIGETPFYDIQNRSYLGGYDKSITVKTIYTTMAPDETFIVCLSNGDEITILANQPGIIVTTSEEAEQIIDKE